MQDRSLFDGFPLIFRFSAYTTFVNQFIHEVSDVEPVITFLNFFHVLVDSLVIWVSVDFHDVFLLKVVCKLDQFFYTNEKF